VAFTGFHEWSQSRRGLRFHSSLTAAGDSWSWGQLELREVPDEAIGQVGPKPALDELGHFFAEKPRQFGGRSVATPVDVGVLGGVRPRFGGSLSGDAVVPPMA
jgi:hypothetical protein